MLATLSSIGTALLLTHLLNCIAAQRPSIAPNCPASLVRFWPAVALGAILLPWLLYPVVGDASEALEFGKVLDGAVACGRRRGACHRAVAVRRVSPLRASRRHCGSLRTSVPSASCPWIMAGNA
jgi:hypothetical protein